MEALIVKDYTTSLTLTSPYTSNLSDHFMPPRKRDTVYQDPLAKLTDFEFDENVVSVFEDMINRSVPGYATIVHNLSHFAARFVEPNTQCYDLGCSLGASTLAMRKSIEDKKGTRIISVDTSADMIKRAKGYIESDSSSIPVEFKQADIRDISIENASMVVLNFTLQFLPIEDREKLLQNVFSGMNKGACLILSEKIRFNDEAIQETLTAVHHQFKREQGYSDLEISQKRDAIENIMKQESSDTHIQRLQGVGFEHTAQWHQNTAFCSFLAIK